MLEIHYKDDGADLVKVYDSAQDFLGAQYREVPDLEDYFEITSVTLAGKPIELSDNTIGGLYNYLIKNKTE